MPFNVLPNLNEALYPEQWIKIKDVNYPQLLDYYYISSYGRVYNEFDDKIIAPRKLQSENKYINASFRLRAGGMRTFDVHRMMLITFMPVPNNLLNKLVCNHKDGVKCHNWLWNLEWVTVRGNSIHAINNGLIKFGTDRANGIVPEYFIRDICKMIEDGYSTAEIIQILNPPVKCNMSNLVNNIKSGHAHSNISKEYDFSNAWDVSVMNRKFTNDQIHIICESFQKFGRDLSTSGVCSIIGIDFKNATYKEKRRLTAAVGGIRNKRNFKEICNMYDY